MIKSYQLLNILKKNKIRNFVGPDSVLKNFLNYLDKKLIIDSLYEGSAIAIAIGQHLSTKKISLYAKFWSWKCD